jgi:hypothetical protein
LLLLLLLLLHLHLLLLLWLRDVVRRRASCGRARDAAGRVLLLLLPLRLRCCSTDSCVTPLESRMSCSNGMSLPPSNTGGGERG